MDEYERRYQKALISLKLPVEQKHLEAGLANYLVYNDLYKEQNGPFNKIKKLFNRGGPKSK